MSGEDGEKSSDSERPAAQNLRDLTGMIEAEAKQQLEIAGFKRGKNTAGGYEHWKHPDGSEIWIRPDGEIVRIGHKVMSSDRSKRYSPRFGFDGRRLTFSDNHNNGEIIIKNF